MEKISFKNLNLKEVDQLSREQLKNVLGGSTNITINCPSGMIPCRCIASSSAFYGCVESPSDCSKLC